MSPYNEGYAGRIRSYPSLVNCCVFDWFSDWPEEALLRVCRMELLDFVLS